MLSGAPRPLTAAAVGALAALALVMLAEPLSRIALLLEQPNEGWNAVHAARWMAGGPLYPPRDAWIVNNYPPLWFMLQGGLGRWLGDAILAGRLVALAAFVLATALIAAAVRALGGERLAGVAAAASFVAVMAAAYRPWIGLAEPQMLAHALMLTGLVVLLHARARRAVVAAALLMVLGGLVKHSVFAVPLAATVWLARYRRPLLGAWLGGALAAAGLAAAAVLAAFGGDFLAGVAYPRLLSFRHLATSFAHASKVAAALAAWAALAWIAWRGSNRGRRPGREGRRPDREGDDAAVGLVNLLILAALLEIALVGSALGVSGNVAFDLVIAASLAVGVLVARIAAVPDQRWRAALRLPGDAVAALLVTAVGLNAAANLPGDVLAPFDPQERARLEALLDELDAVRGRVAAIRGPVACEALSLCLWAGHPSDIDLWKLRHERTLVPTVDPAAVVARIARGEYAAVLLFGRVEGADADRNLPGLYAALEAAYPARAVSDHLSLFWR